MNTFSKYLASVTLAKILRERGGYFFVLRDLRVRDSQFQDGETCFPVCMAGKYEQNKEIIFDFTDFIWKLLLVGALRV